MTGICMLDMFLFSNGKQCLFISQGKNKIQKKITLGKSIEIRLSV